MKARQQKNQDKHPRSGSRKTETDGRIERPTDQKMVSREMRVAKKAKASFSLQGSPLNHHPLKLSISFARHLRVFDAASIIRHSSVRFQRRRFLPSSQNLPRSSRHRFTIQLTT